MISGVIQGSFIKGQPAGASVKPINLSPSVGGIKRIVNAPKPTPHAGLPKHSAVPVPTKCSARGGAGYVAQMNPGPTIGQARSAANLYRVDPHVVLRKTGPGEPLSDALRLHMEHVFNTSFAGVRIHVGPQAMSIGARAFTAGTDLFFAPSEYQPNTVAGRQLIGHELTHVVQQRQGRVRNFLSSTPVIVQDSAMEIEADRMGHKAAAQP